MKILLVLARFFDRMFKKNKIKQFEKLVVFVAISGFVLHLFLIFISRNFGIEVLNKIIQPHYFSAIATPFTILLFFEIFLLILSIPESITNSIGRQYEIVSLIVIREVFKDLGSFELAYEVFTNFSIFYPILLDLTGGLFMFFLVTVFYHIRKKKKEIKKSVSVYFAGFVALKKTIAFILSIVLFSLALYTFINWVIDLPVILQTGSITINSLDFYKSVFSLMVFTDVLMLIISYIYTYDYELFFRNSGFVLSTILIRISLTLEKPYDVLLGVIAMIFGIITLLIYRYFRNVKNIEI